MAAKKKVQRPKAGQIWESTQPSSKGRRFVVTKVSKGYAHCELVSNTPGKKVRRVVRNSKIKLDQFVPSKYILASNQKKNKRSFVKRGKPKVDHKAIWTAREDGSVIDSNGNLIALASSPNLACHIVTLQNRAEGVLKSAKLMAERLLEILAEKGEYS